MEICGEVAINGRSLEEYIRSIVAKELEGG
jgi:hypothetical protein